MLKADFFDDGIQRTVRVDFWHTVIAWPMQLCKICVEGVLSFLGDGHCRLCSELEEEEETAARTGTESPTAGDSYNTIAGKDDSGVIFFLC